MKKKILAVLCAALIICLGIVSAYAIQPPSFDYVTSQSYSYNTHLAEEDIVATTRLFSEMVTLEYFPFLDFICFGRASSPAHSGFRLYALVNGSFTLSDSDITIDGRVIVYSLGQSGFTIFTLLVTTITIPLSETVCYSDGSSVVRSSSYSAGTQTSSNFIDFCNQFHNYYEKVYNYDENIESSYNQGYVNGGADGYREAYGDGYADGSGDGYETGYSEGLSTGYASGLAQGQASGLQQGRQEGYETGYADGLEAGEEIGYSDGYSQGKEDGKTEGIAQGREEGYETGYAEGLEDGYETGYADGLEAGGGSAPLDPIVSVRLFYKIPDDDGSFLFLAWDGSSESTLTFVPASDIPNLGYTLYYTESDFYKSQIDVPSSINFNVPDVIQDRFGYNYGLFTSYNIFNVSAEIELYKSDYNLGYNNGFQAGGNILDGLGTIAAAPVTGLVQALDFEIFGINVHIVVIGLIALFVALLAWKLIKKFIPV